MNNQEFNPVYDNEAASRLEFSPAEDEKPRREEGAQKKEFFADDRDAEKEFSGGLLENAESDDSKKDTASRRKRLKMLLALTGTTVVVASSGVFQPNYHDRYCVSTDQYNDLFEEILTLKENEQYKDILTLVETSEEMQECVATLYPHVAERMAKYEAEEKDPNVHNHYGLTLIYYDGNTASNCRYKISSATDTESQPYIYLETYVGSNGHIEDATIFFSNSFDYSEEYFEKNDSLNLTLFTDRHDNGFPYRLLSFTFTACDKGRNFHGYAERWLKDDNIYLGDYVFYHDMYAEEWNQNPYGDVKEQITFSGSTSIADYETASEDINEQLEYLINVLSKYAKRVHAPTY